MRGKIIRIGLLVLGCFFVLLVRVYWESRAEFRQAMATKQSGNAEEAIIHFERSAHWYFPMNPYVPRALNELWQIGQASEISNASLALMAYDSLRASIYAVRSFYWPNRDWLLRVNPRIAQLRAAQQMERDKNLSFSEVLAFHQKALETDERPRTFWVFVVQIGFFGWLGSVFGLIWKGFNRAGMMFWRPSLPWIFGIIFFFACWVVGLTKA